MKDLIRKLEQLTRPSRDLDALIFEAVTGVSAFHDTTPYSEGRASSRRMIDVPNYTESVTVALTLVPEGYDYGLSWSKQHGLETWVQKPFKSGTCHQGYAPEGIEGDSTRAIALCIAALSAKFADKNG